MSRNTIPNTPQTPFAASDRGGSRGVGLWILFVSMVVFAAISLLLMLAARVPAIANSLNDLLGVSRNVSPDRPDRSTHLFMLLFCYASPLLLMLWVSLLRSLAMRSRSVRSNKEAISTESDPFA